MVCTSRLDSQHYFLFYVPEFSVLMLALVSVLQIVSLGHLRFLVVNTWKRVPGGL